ncbi:MAG: LysR family transcriptional regulator [Chloroflexi bacterium AL-W]|nr:LysR family transcriptional regulator [Chloroflexi bacterium AL-N1]NOK68305.1 LysR family transcriptional regulator [Chloroflexi bacterium AL-N10]NOK73951.1 LysR family transcriptional regulator [Chloroflexi bacterium AL-N5]NOK82919.1 LysR family transcriptional regulator [Chloroflexi bacterium AL-W]NOK90441.1 LysR family transcriptional regulator [Chloroflexi bacterium AL-N15]
MKSNRFVYRSIKRSYMNITQLQLLIALVEKGNFTDAAVSIHITQPAASAALSKLEAELGVTLFHRGRNGVTPTAAGADMLSHAQEILNQMSIMHQKAQAAQSHKEDILRLGSLPLLSARLLVDIINEFQSIVQGVRVHVLEGTGEEVHDWIVSGIVDVGIITLVDKSTDSVRITQDELLVGIPSGHSLAAHTSVKMTDLSNESFVISKSMREIAEPVLLSQGYPRPKTHYVVRDNQTALTMVREGLGCTMLSKMLCDNNFDSVDTLPFDPPIIFDICLGVRSFKTASPMVKLFIEKAQDWSEIQGSAREKIF